MMTKTRPFQHVKQHRRKGRKSNWNSTFFLYILTAENDLHERVWKVQNRPLFHNDFMIFSSFSDFFRKMADSCFLLTMRNRRPKDSLADRNIDGAVAFVWNERTPSLRTELKGATDVYFQKWRPLFSSIEMMFGDRNTVIRRRNLAQSSASKVRPLCRPAPTWKDVNRRPMSVSRLAKMWNKSTWHPNVQESNGVQVLWHVDSERPKVTPHHLNNHRHRRHIVKKSRRTRLLMLLNDLLWWVPLKIMFLSVQTTRPKPWKWTPWKQRSQ